jgi:hypothetical protein
MRDWNLKNIIYVKQMIKINILSNYDFISYYFFYPLLANKYRLKQMNISVDFYDRLKDSIYACDILMLDSKYFRPLWKNRENTLSLIQKIRENARRIIWLDTTDSTGATHFQVMPYIDKYWKKQLLRDVTLYEKEFFGARIYTDYYKKHFALENENGFYAEPIKKEYIGKLSFSWNLGAGPITTNEHISNLMRLIPWSVKKILNFRYHFTAYPPDNERDNTVCFRGSRKYGNSVLSFQRLKTIRALERYDIKTKPLGKKEYIKEIRNSKIGVSPFGGGEVCFRDFEIVLCGALLFKPSMEHLITYPDIYRENETYISFKWDFSDFTEKIDNLCSNPSFTTEISFNAQKKYGQFFTEEGQDEFCRRFSEKIAFAD